MPDRPSRSKCSKQGQSVIEAARQSIDREKALVVRIAVSSRPGKTGIVVVDLAKVPSGTTSPLRKKCPFA